MPPACFLNAPTGKVGKSTSRRGAKSPRKVPLMKTKIVLCLMIVIMLGAAGNMVMVWKNCHLTESDTQEMTATVAEVLCETGTWSIRVAGPDGTLSIPGAVSESLSPEVMQSLQEGQTIHFRMQSPWAKTFAENGTGRAVALRTDMQDIITLADYNRAMQAASSGGWPVWGLLESGLLALTVYLARKLRKENAASTRGA